MNKILTVNEAARYLGIKTRIILSWIKSKKTDPPHYSFLLPGATELTYFFKREDIEQLAETIDVKS